MAESHLLGQQGEELAASHLKNSGFRILFRNWKWGKNEIDIIAENRDNIVFVEVKTRADDLYIRPGDIVTKEKQKSIIRAADGYLNRYNVNKEARFDIIIILRKEESFELNHIEAAFYPTLR
jgi:putative endonuclease